MGCGCWVEADEGCALCAVLELCLRFGGRSNMRLHNLEKAGHWLHVDDPEGLHQLIDPAFRGVGE